jgi:glycosyltransferase involved in cell wall biosynthesis
MRLLLHINSLAVGGAERVLLKLARHWHELGHDVMVVTQAPVEQDQLPVPAGVQRASTQTGGVSGHWLRALVRNAERSRRLRAVLQAWKPDRIISFLPTANVVALLAARGLGIPVIVGERMFPAFLALGWLQRCARDRQYPKAAVVVVQTEESASWYRQALALVNLVVIPNGISLPLDDQAPHIEPDDLLPSAACVVLTIGRMAEPKRPEDAVRAFAAAFADDPAWHLVLIGDGDKQSLVQVVIASTSLADRIHWIPRAGNVATWYQRAEMCVLVSGAEGFPNVLLEAMAMGCVPIAYDCSTGPREVIRDGINGFLVPVGDVSSLIERMRQLGTDDVLRGKLARSAKDVTDSHSDAAFYGRWDAVLTQVASAQR